MRPGHLITYNDDDGGSLMLTGITTTAAAVFPVGTNPTPVSPTGSSGTATATVSFVPASATAYNETLTVTTSNASCPTFVALKLV